MNYVRLFTLCCLPFVLVYCGPSPDEIVRDENRKFNESSRRDDAKVREAVDQIKEDSRLIAEGKYMTSDQQTLTPEPTTPPPVQQPAPTRATAATPVSPPPASTSPYRYDIQLASLASQTVANGVAEEWKGRGYTNVEVITHRSPVTGSVTYRVRLTGYPGFSHARRAADDLVARYNADIWIVDANKEPS